MFNNGLAQDCLKICKNINNSVSPFAKWAIVNIGFSSEHEKFNYPTHPNIKESFGFTFDESVEFLKQNKVILATDTYWYIGIKTGALRKFGVSLHEINKKAREIGYIDTESEAMGYYMSSNDPKLIPFMFGPSNRGHVSALIDMEYLRKFIWWYMGTRPRININRKTMEFLGQSIKVDGDQERACLEILIKNLGSMVSQKDIYELRNPGKYDSDIKRKKITPSTANKDLIKRIKTKIHTNKILDSVIHIFQSDGLGMFIDQNKLNEITQKELLHPPVIDNPNT